MNLSELSVRRPTLVVVVFAMLTFLGIMSYRSLKYELIPDFSSPVFTVTTVYPGAGPLEVENSVSRQIEEALSGLNNIDVIRSVSLEGASMVIVTLKIDARIDPIVNEAVRRIQAIRGLLPPQAMDPVIRKFSVNELPVMTLSVQANLSPTALYDELNYRISPAFARIEGVAEVNFLGATEREIQVNIDHDKLAAHNLSVLQVVNTIQLSNHDYPVGRISNDHTQTMLRLSSTFMHITDMAALIITRHPDGSLVKLEDLAEIIDTEKDAASLYRVNGKPAVGIEITKQEGANTVAVCNAIKEEIASIEKSYTSSQMQFT
ncbi:MAG: efflux RND transporter permease subunit, partial [Proteiniphilum sp.]|nr:efflux RND transporter permease subunit [Proteiniphilum sp.]